MKTPRKFIVFENKTKWIILKENASLMSNMISLFIFWNSYLKTSIVIPFSVKDPKYEFMNISSPLKKVHDLFVPYYI